MFPICRRQVGLLDFRFFFPSWFAGNAFYTKLQDETENAASRFVITLVTLGPFQNLGFILLRYAVNLVRRNSIDKRLKFDIRGQKSESKKKIWNYYLLAIQIPKPQKPCSRYKRKDVIIESFELLSNVDDTIFTCRIC